MADMLGNLRLFIRVARTGSLSRTARDLGLSQSGVSRALSSLEEDVGGVLLTRTTRRVSLTEVGAEFLARVEPLVAALDDAAEGVRAGDELHGMLRVAMPTGVATREIIPRLPAFLERHRHLRLEIQLEDRIQELLRDEIDVAIRFGDMPSSNAVSRAFSVNERVLVASPAYLQAKEAPSVPTDVFDHAFIAGPAGPSPRLLVFERVDERVEVRPEVRFQASANEGAVALCVAGLGLLSTGLWGCRAELQDGRLVRILDDWRLGRTDVQVFLPAGRKAKIAARAFADFLVAQYR